MRRDMISINCTLRLASYMVSIPPAAKRLAVFIGAMDEMGVGFLEYSITSVFPAMYDESVGKKMFVVYERNGEYYADIEDKGTTLDFAEVAGQRHIVIEYRGEDDIKFRR